MVHINQSLDVCAEICISCITFRCLSRVDVFVVLLLELLQLPLYFVHTLRLHHSEQHRNIKHFRTNVASSGWVPHKIDHELRRSIPMYGYCGHKGKVSTGEET